MSAAAAAPILFGKFIITSQVFLQTPHTIAFVNLKPLLPGHVLVSPRRVVPRLSDLTAAEVSDLFLTVQRVGRTVERVYSAAALNIAIQDGFEAGQSVPHVHAHVIPRRKKDLEDDAVYGLLEGEEGDVGKHLAERDNLGGAEVKSERPKFPKVDEAFRTPRTEQEMVEEAEMLGKEMEKV